MKNYHRPETKFTNKGFLQKFNNQIVNNKNETLIDAQSFIKSIKYKFGFNELHEAEMKWMLKVLYTNKKYSDITHSSFYEAVSLSVMCFVTEKYCITLDCDLFDFIEQEFRREVQFDVINQSNFTYACLMNIFYPELDVDDIKPVICKAQARRMIR